MVCGHLDIKGPESKAALRAQPGLKPVVGSVAGLVAPDGYAFSQDFRLPQRVVIGVDL